MSVINGYNCANCSEELLAKRGIDPAQGPTKVALKEQTERSEDKRAAAPAQGARALAVTGDVGTRLNVFA